MQYRNLGNSGLKVSVISFGNMVNSKIQTREEDTKIIKRCLDAGINFFDTAELCDQGQAEVALGQILKDLKVERQSVVIATKVWTSPDAERNSTASLNRKHMKQAVNASLKRLDLQYVDIVFAHNYDQQTPLEQVCRAFNELIENGKTFYWGTSNWNAQDVFNAFRYCQTYNLHKPICAQNQYNMLVRKQMEVQYTNLFQNYKYGLISWSPLAGGFLTGKHLDGISKQQGNRLTTGYWLEVFKKFYLEPHSGEKTVNALRQLKLFAEKQLQCTLTQLALAWVINFKSNTTALIGARNLVQLEDSLKAMNVLAKLTPQVEARVNKILANTPEPAINFLMWKAYDPIRPVAKQ